MRIGIDLGGTKIEAIALGSDGSVLTRIRVPTPRHYAGCIDAIGTLVQRVGNETGSTGSVGVGIPGTVIAATGLVKNANSTWLNGQPLLRDLEAKLERPVRLMNDANCFALSEASDGAAAGAGIVFGVILGTGTGGGVVVNGRCLIGANQIAGEWGHNPLPWPTPSELPGDECYCGKHGCIETFLSGPSFERDHIRASGNVMSSRAIVDAALDGEVSASATMTRYISRLGRALASVVNVIDPDVIVLGGGISNIAKIAELAQRALEPYVFSHTVATRVVRNMHGDSSGVRGAAWLWP